MWAEQSKTTEDAMKKLASTVNCLCDLILTNFGAVKPVDQSECSQTVGLGQTKYLMMLLKQGMWSIILEHNVEHIIFCSSEISYRDL